MFITTTLLGAISLIFGFYYGGILILISLIGFSLKKGIIIDFENRIYKNYWRIPGLSFGKWEKLPDAKRLTITKSIKRQEYNVPHGGAQTLSKEILHYLNIRTICDAKIILSCGNYKQVLADAHVIAKFLSLDILDCSSNEKKVRKIE